MCDIYICIYIYIDLFVFTYVSIHTRTSSIVHPPICRVFTYVTTSISMYICKDKYIYAYTPTHRKSYTLQYIRLRVSHMCWYVSVRQVVLVWLIYTHPYIPQIYIRIHTNTSYTLECISLCESYVLVCFRQTSCIGLTIYTHTYIPHIHIWIHTNTSYSLKYAWNTQIHETHAWLHQYMERVLNIYVCIMYILCIY